MSGMSCTVQDLVGQDESKVDLYVCPNCGKEFKPEIADEPVSCPWCGLEFRYDED